MSENPEPPVNLMQLGQQLATETLQRAHLMLGIPYDTEDPSELTAIMNAGIAAVAFLEGLLKAGLTQPERENMRAFLDTMSHKITELLTPHAQPVTPAE